MLSRMKCPNSLITDYFIDTRGSYSSQFYINRGSAFVLGAYVRGHLSGAFVLSLVISICPPQIWCKSLSQLYSGNPTFIQYCTQKMGRKNCQIINRQIGNFQNDRLGRQLWTKTWTERQQMTRKAKRHTVSLIQQRYLSAALQLMVS